MLYVVFGVVGGILGGMGMGGGTLLIPLLTIFAGVNQQMAQGINLISFLPMAIVAIIIHNKNKLIDFKTAFPIIFTGIISTVGASFLATGTNELLLKLLFGFFLIYLGAVLFLSIFFEKKN